MPTFPWMARPPINEVICGLIFRTPLALTAVQCGLYWGARLETFPEHEIRDAVNEEPGTVFLGLPPVRVWLMTATKTRLIQIQHDRFYVNWRRQADADAYPQFRHQEGGEEPLLPFALREWKHFVEFCARNGLQPEPRAIELTKIDLLASGTHWTDPADLARLVPAIEPLVRTATGNRRDIVWRYGEQLSDRENLSVMLASAKNRTTNEDVIRVETRIRSELSGSDLNAAFARLDEIVDRAFFDLLAPQELRRFGVEG